MANGRYLSHLPERKIGSLRGSGTSCHSCRNGISSSMRTSSRATTSAIATAAAEGDDDNHD